MLSVEGQHGLTLLVQLHHKKQVCAQSKYCNINKSFPVVSHFRAFLVPQCNFKQLLFMLATDKGC